MNHRIEHGCPTFYKKTHEVVIWVVDDDICYLWSDYRTHKDTCKLIPGRCYDWGVKAWVFPATELFVAEKLFDERDCNVEIVYLAESVEPPQPVLPAVPQDLVKGFAFLMQVFPDYKRRWAFFNALADELEFDTDRPEVFDALVEGLAGKRISA